MKMEGNNSRQTLPVSVVIATLAGAELEQTIQYLRNGLSVPGEILVCIPEGVTPQANIVEDECVRIVWTPCRGQVAQRAIGLTQAKSDYVMQMDDDVVLSETSIGLLYDAFVKLGPRNAVSPLFMNADTQEYLTQYERSIKGFVKSLMASLIGGAPWGHRRMGKVDKAGIPYAVDRRFVSANALVEAQWVPGGCVICHRDDLVLENYYPFAGKAYSEDVIHSLLWRRKGVRLWVASNVSIATHLAPMPATFKSISADHQARLHVVALNDGHAWRCRLWFVLSLMRLSLRSLFRK
ncbi:glycosyltransferase [Methylophilus sp. TWE2]|uniref:glycosyltransferase n=1 Tax=Methylophilus sp. TWE2 TaxID=1662285 RepID=UPI0009E61D41|nr:glycosyltransferase [Methylophilus sp. TWE2]